MTLPLGFNTSDSPQSSIANARNKFNSDVGQFLFQGTVVNFYPLTAHQNIGPSLSDFFSNVNCTASSCLSGFLNAAFTMALSAGAILAVLRLAYAGWLYMGAADMWGSKQKAKEVIGRAILGLLLLIGIWIILDQINPNLLNLDVTKCLRNPQSCTAPTPTTPPQSVSAENSSGS